MRGLLLASACVYAARSQAPAVIRYYFDVLFWHALLLYAFLYFYPDISRVYAVVYVAVTLPLVLAGFAVSVFYCQARRPLRIYLMCCAFGAVSTLTALQVASSGNCKIIIMAIEGGAFLAVGLIMAFSIECAETPTGKLVASVLAANWLSKALLDFALVRWDFSPQLLEAGAVLPWAFFLASAVVVGFSFRASTNRGNA